MDPFQFMEQMECVEEFVFHAYLKDVFLDFYRKVWKYEVAFVIPGQYDGNKIIYNEIPYLIDQYASDTVTPLKLPTGDYMIVGHTHIPKYPKLSGHDTCYCNYIGIAGVIVISSGTITDACKFSFGEYNDNANKVKFSFSDKLKFNTTVRKEIKNIPVLPITKLPDLLQGYSGIMLTIDHENLHLEYEY